MTEPEFLPPADVKMLAGGAASIEAQAAALTRAGIPHKIVGRRLLVSRHHARLWLSGQPVTPTRRPNIAAAS